MQTNIGRRSTLGAIAAATVAGTSHAAEETPITIGFAEALTGSLAAVG